MEAAGAVSAQGSGWIAFYVKQDQQSGRTVAFASKDDVFAIATDESLMATTLDLLAGQPAPSLAKEEWFQNISAGRRQGDLRLIYDLRDIEKTPQFRTYWIQENETGLKEYAAGISDLFETPAGFEEQRVLTRAEQAPPPSSSAAMETLVSAVEPKGSLYRAWASPSKEQLAASLEQVVYGEGPATNPLADQTAPADPTGFVQPVYAPDGDANRSAASHERRPEANRYVSGNSDSNAGRCAGACSEHGGSARRRVYRSGGHGGDLLRTSRSWRRRNRAS